MAYDKEIILIQSALFRFANGYQIHKITLVILFNNFPNKYKYKFRFCYYKIAIYIIYETAIAY